MATDVAIHRYPSLSVADDRHRHLTDRERSLAIVIVGIALIVDGWRSLATVVRPWPMCSPALADAIWHPIQSQA